MTVDRSVLKDIEASGLRDFGLFIVGLLAGAAGGWAASHYLNERNDQAAAHVRMNLQERLTSAEQLNQTLQGQLVVLQKHRDQLQKQLSRVPDCTALTPLIEGKRTEVARQEQRVHLSAPMQIRSVSERGETETNVFAASDAHERERSALATLQEQLRILEVRQAYCVSGMTQR